ncbi:MAG: C1 family peptidase [Coprobacter sp.]|nr:C1 family peptidase [Coprobacter sp.]
MRTTTFALAMALALGVVPGWAQKKEGGIDAGMMSTLRDSYKHTAEDRALRNAMAGTDIQKLAANAEVSAVVDGYFSHKVPTKGITDQESSGRCWLFTGLNVLRAQVMAEHDLPECEFSQAYCFFYDQLEKANLFLQAVIDTRDKPMTDQTVEWLFKNPLSDGGQFTGVSDLIGKYGIVPKEVMNESFSANNTTRMAMLLKMKLREYGLQLRELPAKAKASEIKKQKTEMLTTIYRMLALTIGEPPTEFTWTRKDKAGNPVSTKKYTPQSFYEEYVGNDLTNGYVMLMNDPTRPYYKLYEIEYDRHVYDGYNWTYINLPVEDIKPIAIASIKDSTAMYFSCDVGKYLDSKKGTLDLRNYDYESLMGTTFGMDKKQRVQTFASGSSHAMTLMAVDLDENGAPRKWMVENSWGAASGYKGHLIMTDEWFDEYMFRVIAEKKYIPQNILDILKQEPTLLPAWDPMFSADE